MVKVRNQMDNQYKVEFLSTVNPGKINVNRPVEEIDLKYQLEALLVERYKEGYKLFQIIDHKQMNPMNGKDLSSLMVVFEKMEQ